MSYRTSSRAENYNTLVIMKSQKIKYSVFYIIFFDKVSFIGYGHGDFFIEFLYNDRTNPNPEVSSYNITSANVIVNSK